VPEGGAEDERPESNPMRHRGEPPERGEGLGCRERLVAPSVPGEGEEEMVGDPCRVEAQILRSPSPPGQRLPGRSVAAGKGVAVMWERESKPHEVSGS
jgi:hypothetical protein